MGRRRIRRLMRSDGLWPRWKRRFRVTTQAHPTKTAAPNLVDRRFDRDAPNDVWVGDISYLRTGEGWLYLAVVVDLFSRKVVGWAVSARLTAALATGALAMALGRRPDHGVVIHHTDRGSQYSSGACAELLKIHGLTASMSRKANCYDNAVAESFFATLKAELGDTFTSRSSASAAVFDYIEGFYNPVRRHSKLNYMSPNEYEATQRS